MNAHAEGSANVYTAKQSEIQYRIVKPKQCIGLPSHKVASRQSDQAAALPCQTPDNVWDKMTGMSLKQPCYAGSETFIGGDSIAS